MTQPTTPTTWTELAAQALGRQFPAAESWRGTGVGAETVHELVDRIGPIQSQAARAPFLGLCARADVAYPAGTTDDAAVDHATITAAYEEHRIVRGSTIRGTVHTSTADVHPILDVLTRLGIGSRWGQYLPFERTRPEEVWRALEMYARDTWRTVAELRTFMAEWLAEHESPAAGEAALEQGGRYLAFSHGGLIRRPLKGGWEGQGAPAYRTAAAVVGGRDDRYADPERAVRDAVRLHLRCHGPSSRQDIAWWSGLRLSHVDAALTSLAGELTTRTGPDGRAYHDLVGLLPTQRELTGVVLLPEFDALLCAYEPAGRARFITPEHHRILFQQANGLIRPPLLVDGRITGFWRLEGSGRTRALTAYWFPGTRRPGVREVREAARSVTRALPVTLTEVRVVRHR